MGFRPVRQADDELSPDMRARAFGQVPTPAEIARAMAHWVLAGARPPRTLLEPGAGRFAFGRAALGIDSSLSVTGVEIDIQAAAPPAGAELVLGDFLDNEVLEGRRFDAILCNPPYVRHHYLEPEYKRAVAERLGARHDLRLSRLGGTHVYFLLRALELLAPGGRMAFLTGAEWLEAAYGAPIRALLARSGMLRAILVCSSKETVFPGALTTAAVLLLEALPCETTAHATDLPYREWVDAIISGGTRRYIPAHTLARQRWTSRPMRENAEALLLGDLFRVRRGVATGANSFFVLSAEQARMARLPKDVLAPCIASPRTRDQRWLFYCDEPRTALPLEVHAYVRRGESLGLDARYLCRTRSPWYRVERIAPAPLLIAYMARDRVPCIDNDAKRIHLNLWQGIYPRPGTTRTQVARLGDFLRSSAGAGALAEVARTYAGGLLKLEPRALMALRLPPEFSRR